MSQPTALPSQWRDIASAPRQRVILLWAVTSDDPPNWKMSTGDCAENYDGELEWTWDGRVLRAWETKPTHWMPLPSPPVIAGTDELNRQMRSAAEMAISVARLALARIANGDPQPARLAGVALADIEALAPIAADGVAP